MFVNKLRRIQKKSQMFSWIDELCFLRDILIIKRECRKAAQQGKTNCRINILTPSTKMLEYASRIELWCKEQGLRGVIKTHSWWSSVSCSLYWGDEDCD